MKKIFLMMAAVVLLTACNGNKFRVDGTVEGASDTTTLVLEASSNGQWVLVDSVEVSKDGHFEVSADAPEVPNIYQLRCGNQAICFPIDSLDHLTLKAKMPNFNKDYTISGSAHAEQVMKIDKEAMQFAGGKGTPEERQAWKNQLARQIANDPSGIVAYYTINKYIDGQPLFDPMNDDDLRFIGAVANAFNSFRPNDPRTKYLVNLLLDGQRRRRADAAPTDTVYASEASIINIKLQDLHGKEHSLQEVANSNRVVLLNFTAYQAEFSPQFNKILNDIYKGGGVAIYQVSLDDNNVAWRQAAENLPWICVYDPMGVESRNVGNYNVTGIPTTFIIRNGDIVERIEDAAQLKSAVARYK